MIENMQKHGIKILLLVSLAINIVCTIAIILLVRNQILHENDTTTHIVPAEEYSFLSSRIINGYRNDLHINFVPLRTVLRSYIGDREEKISLYFEYLPSGSSIGINDTNEIAMASLIKVPTVMAIYDKISRGEASMESVLTLQQDKIDTKYSTFWEEGIGATISVKDAIYKSLVESDNTVHQMLYSLLNQEDQKKLFENIDVRIVREDTTLQPYISAKSYASILKSLYLSTFLSLEYSNEILTLLSKNNINEGIPSVIPDTVAVARKSGLIQTPKETDVYNDCAIVYYPERPYILCIFVSGEDEKSIRDEIAMLSKFVFTYVRDINIETN